MTGCLTARQRQVLMLVADGRNLAEAAVELRLTHDAVRSHMAAILARLDARTQAHAVALALRAGELA
ncbi:response regulator transcription factor [Actinoplanes sp. URMC 104]|uniref:response regulator transcription factor n=1 Tax=Actinoplanes sp. URMC 104 TaxID=3423409 RepID=UPI003F1C87E8